MASRRAKRGRGGGAAGEVTKEEYAVAKFMRSKVPTKTTTLCGIKVDYFVGSKAIDALLASHWGENCKKKESKLFESREDAVAYCQKLLDKKELFHRARKIVQNKKDDEEDAAPLEELKVRRRNKKKDAKETGKETKEDPSDAESNSKKKKKPSKAESLAEDPPTEEEGAAFSSKKSAGRKKREKEEDEVVDGTPQVKEKKKKRIKLDMHEDQTFVDGNEAYVWIYDPIRPTTFLFGLAVVVGAIAVCLFPLWPEWMRVGAYYLSLVAAGLLGVILALSIFRYVFYAFLWLATLGKVQFFLLPNLTEDVGFFESFAPVYELETHWGNETDESDKKKKKKRKKAKDSDNEGDGDDADSDAERKSPQIPPEETPDDGGEEIPPEDDSLDNEMSQGEEDGEREDAERPSGADDADLPSGATSSASSDAEYEIISHGDFNNGDNKLSSAS